MIFNGKFFDCLGWKHFFYRVNNFYSSLLLKFEKMFSSNYFVKIIIKKPLLFGHGRRHIDPTFFFFWYSKFFFFFTEKMPNSLVFLLKVTTFLTHLWFLWRKWEMNANCLVWRLQALFHARNERKSDTKKNSDIILKKCRRLFRLSDRST